ncbi:hypothetical protein Bca52824_017802 [Brassica carinata]|uniref:Uncharacterized protein n=1 Tax=Brassica carinata TaxID=52824 RepID=A0A8X8AWQ4_BRACI|nr:hypothetical protein Bca52824_017802 [Brassica carinata]
MASRSGLLPRGIKPQNELLHRDPPESKLAILITPSKSYPPLPCSFMVRLLLRDSKSFLISDAILHHDAPPPRLQSS